MNFYVRDSYIRALFFSEEQAGLVHMAMGGAAPRAEGHVVPSSGHYPLWSVEGGPASGIPESRSGTVRPISS